MLAAVGQICSTASVAKNLLLCQSLIRRSSLAGVKLLYLPEASDFLAPPSEVGRLSSPVSNHPFLEGIKKYARQYSMWVGVGIHESVEGEEHKCYNTNVLIDSNGLVVSAYRKLHLFDVNIAGGATILESNTTVKGDKLLKPVDSPMGKIGLLTCYDLRFPEVSLMLRKAGAEIIVYPSAFTIKTGAAHWMILLRARAIETQCYIRKFARCFFRGFLLFLTFILYSRSCSNWISFTNKVIFWTFIDY